jgi:UDP-N-acetylglucosamine 2-epimerase
MTIILILGTRPQIIKSVPIVHEALKQDLEIQIIHTGQHYDHALSQVFFEELSPPEPFANLNVGSGSQVFQIAEMMSALEKHLVAKKPSLVLVPGDTNSALAGALTAVKLGLPLAHLESGARCYDMKMAEEVNRRLIDHCAEVLFAPTLNCQRNLQNESVVGKIFLTGDTMYDAFLNFTAKSQNNDILDRLHLTGEEYGILTTHRAENVDDPDKLKGIFSALEKSSIPTIFPIHPRTRKRLEDNKISLNASNIRPINPVGYLEMLKLLKYAKIVITDSGGLQKEAFWSKTPCITIRDRVEWVETVEMGVNIVAGVLPSRIVHAMEYLEANYDDIKKKFKDNPFGDGKASERIVEILKKNFGK